MILDILPYFWGSYGCMISKFANPDMLIVIIFWIIFVSLFVANIILMKKILKFKKDNYGDN